MFCPLGSCLAMNRLTNNGSKFRILLVEDNPCDAELTEAFLNQFLKCQVKTVFTRAQFEEALESLKPDLIVSDAGLPSFDGMTALKIASEKQPRIPVVFFTGNNDPHKKAEAFAQGAVDYVSKDDAPALLGALQRLCNNQQVLQLEIEQILVTKTAGAASSKRPPSTSPACRQRPPTKSENC